MAELPNYIRLISTSSPIIDSSSTPKSRGVRQIVCFDAQSSGESRLAIGDRQYTTFRLRPGGMRPGERFIAGTADRTVCDGFLLFSREAHQYVPPGVIPTEIISIIHSYPGDRNAATERIAREAEHHYPWERKAILVTSQPPEEVDTVANALSLQGIVDQLDAFVGTNNAPTIITTISGRDIEQRITAGENELTADVLFIATRENRIGYVDLTEDEVDL